MKAATALTAAYYRVDLKWKDHFRRTALLAKEAASFTQLRVTWKIKRLPLIRNENGKQIRHTSQWIM
jgi:hypothetical protein